MFIRDRRNRLAQIIILSSIATLDRLTSATWLTRRSRMAIAHWPLTGRSD